MKSTKFKNEAIKATLRSIDEPVENWKTGNYRLNTFIIDDLNPMRSNVDLRFDEEPVLECILNNSFLLITTERLISRYRNTYQEIDISKIVGFGQGFEKENYTNDKLGKYAKTNTISVKDKENNEVIFEIDSIHPAFFVKILINNLSNYINKGTWYLNPSRTWGG